MLNVEIDEKLRLIDMSIAIYRSETPRLTAVKVLPTLSMKVLYIISDVGSELGAVVATVAWAVAMSIPESFIVALPVYQALTTEASASFWAFCWWCIALVKIVGLITGNQYIRRVGCALGLFAWGATLYVLWDTYKTYNILIGLTGGFTFVALWNYTRASLALQQHIAYMDATKADTDDSR